MKAGLAAYLGLVFMTSPAVAEGRVAEVFANTCLEQFPDFKAIDITAYRPITRSVANDPGLPPSVPLIIPTGKTSWVAGSPAKKSADDFALLVSEGTILEKPARGCAVFGMGGGTFQEETLLTKFQAHQFISEIKRSLTPGYRIWLVTGSGGKAFLGISVADTFAPAGASMFLVVPDPSAAQHFADLLRQQKN